MFFSFFFKCHICQGNVTYKNLAICKECFSHFLQDPEFCINCKVFEKKHQCFFKNANSYSEELYYGWLSTHKTETALKAWKKNGGLFLDTQILNPLKSKLNDLSQKKTWDYLVPVPQKSNRILQLNGGSVFRLTQKISKWLQIPILESLEILKKSKSNAMLSQEERFYHSIEYRIKKNIPNDKKILLIDDFYTTGSTLHLTKDFLKSSFKNIFIDFFVLAIRVMNHKI